MSGLTVDSTTAIWRTANGKVVCVREQMRNDLKLNIIPMLALTESASKVEPDSSLLLLLCIGCRGGACAWLEGVCMIIAC